MVDLTRVFGPDGFVLHTRSAVSLENQLKNTMRINDIVPPDQIILDGNIHRFNTQSNGRSNDSSKSGWYVAFSDGIPSGVFGDWRTDLEVAWRADIGRELRPDEVIMSGKRIEEARAVREAGLKKARENVSATVQKIWYEASAASPDHPYLQRKGISVHGARITGNGRLMIPLYGDDDKLSSLQYISQDGSKLYHAGGQTSGKYWMVGTLDEPGVLYMAEGVATAATITEETGRPVIVAFSASNLPKVAGILREKYGVTQEIIIVADNDKSGVGQNYADQASAKFGTRTIIIPEEGMDANDYKQAGHDLLSLLMRPSGVSVIDKIKVISGDQLGTDYEAPDELVQNLITMNSLSLIYGDSNSGKTFLALSIATAISEGIDCYGRKTEQGLVVYLASEAPRSIRSRVQAIKKYYGFSLENLFIVQVTMNFFSGNNDALDVIELCRIVEEMKGMKVRLIIGDTLSRLAAGANENSGESMGPVMARFDLVSQTTGAAIMIIHHNGKDAAKGSRGWSGIRAHIDTEIEVSEKDSVRFASVTKQRELPGKGEAIYFKLELVEMGITKFGEVVFNCVAVQDDQSMNEKPQKKLSKYDENIRTMERAWFASGAEERENKPYISRSALSELMIKDGLSERTARNKVNPSRNDGIILPLLNSEVIEIYEHGWIFSNENIASSMLIRKNSDKY